MLFYRLVVDLLLFLLSCYSDHHYNKKLKDKHISRINCEKKHQATTFYSTNIKPTAYRQYITFNSF